jgi:hypothetical protein
LFEKPNNSCRDFFPAFGFALFDPAIVEKNGRSDYGEDRIAFIQILSSDRLQRIFRPSPASYGGAPGCSRLNLLAKVQDLRVLFG